jgi:integrase
MTEPKKRRGRRANGEGAITRRKDGLWQAAIYVPQPDGTIRRRYLYNRDRDRLREQLNELSYQLGKGVLPQDGAMTVGGYLDQWLAEVAAKQLARRPTPGYETNVRLHIKPLIGSKKLAKLTARDVRQMIETLRAKPLSRGIGIMSDRAVQYVHATLRAALEQACREELISRNVAKLVQSNVRDAGQHEPYSVDESKRVEERSSRCAGPMWTSMPALSRSWAACSASGPVCSVFRPRPAALSGRFRCRHPVWKPCEPIGHGKTRIG